MKEKQSNGLTIARSPALASRDAGFANFVVGKHELLPIPQQDLDYNPNMTQNPAW